MTLGISDSKRVFPGVRRPLLAAADGGRPLPASRDAPGEDRPTTLARVLREISRLVWAADPTARLQGRVKSISSLLAKLRTHPREVDGVLDSIGVRIIIPGVTQCYRLIDRIHRRFGVLDGEFDDYVRNPKPNGYRSIHTTILASNGQPVEVQVRTPRMHAFAEVGPAAHWLYKRRRASAGIVESRTWVSSSPWSPERP